MEHRFGDAPRASLLRAYSAEEVAQLERVLATPCADLHVRVNLLKFPSRDALLDLLCRQCEQSGSALLMVSHDERLADRFDQTVRLDDIARVTPAAAA